MSCVVITKCQKEFGMSCAITSHQSIPKKKKRNTTKCLSELQSVKKKKTQFNVQVY
jgi:hypothetical protein